MSRREYFLRLNINDRNLEKVIIDRHYEEKHADSVTDEIVLSLVRQLDGKIFVPQDKDEEGYLYFVNDRMEHDKRFYKLIWLLREGELFVGIINAYRR